VPQNRSRALPTLNTSAHNTPPQVAHPRPRNPMSGISNASLLLLTTTLITPPSFPHPPPPILLAPLLATIPFNPPSSPADTRHPLTSTPSTMTDAETKLYIAKCVQQEQTKLAVSHAVMPPRLPPKIPSRTRIMSNFAHSSSVGILSEWL
jgi:hypothetical protein